MTRPISLKLTDTEELVLRVLCTDYGYDSFSAVLRAGLGAMATKHKLDASFDQEIEQERRQHQPRRNFRSHKKITVKRNGQKEESTGPDIFAGLTEDDEMLT